MKDAGSSANADAKFGSLAAFCHPDVRPGLDIQQGALAQAGAVFNAPGSLLDLDLCLGRQVRPGMGQDCPGLPTVKLRWAGP